MRFHILIELALALALAILNFAVSVYHPNPYSFVHRRRLVVCRLSTLLNVN